jgi:hypothetical protein
LPRTSIPAQTVVAYMDQSRSLSKILIVDCCFSGAIASALTQRGNATDQVAQALRRELKGHGFYVLTASSDVQTAEEKEGDEYGLLTKHIINGILSGDADENDDGLVSMHELSLYVQKQVESESSQSPKSWSAQIAHGDLAIAKTAPKRKKRLRTICRAIPKLVEARRLSSNMAVAVLKELMRRDTLSDSTQHEQDELIDLLHSNLSSPDRLVTVIYGVFHRKIKDANMQRDTAVRPPVADVSNRPRTTSDSKSLEDLMVQAEIFLQYGLLAKGVERLERIRALYPFEEHRNNNLRRLLVTAGLIPEEPLDNGGDDPTAWHNLGIAFREMGLVDEAIHELLKASSAFERGHKYPEILATYTALAECSLAKGTPGAAIHWYGRALRVPGLDSKTRAAISASLRDCTEHNHPTIQSRH